MSYPYFRRNGDAFYKIIGQDLITKVVPDSQVEYYLHVGLTDESQQEVMNYDVCPEQDWDSVLDDLKEVCRVGSRPNIPPPPNP